MTLDERTPTEEVVEEKVAKPKKKVRAAKKSDHLYVDGQYDAPDFSANHKIKCKVRAAKVFGVTIDHLSKVYYDLNGKKVDGIYITELIDRFGFSDGQQLSRAQLSNKYGYGNNTTPVDVAESKVKDILQSSDIKKAYVAHIRDIKDEFSKETNDKAIYGE